MPEHWGLEDGDIPCLDLEFLRTGEIERPLRGDDMGQDIQHPGFFFDLLADLREKALDIVDRQREHVEIAGAVHVPPSAQELSRFAKGRLWQCHDDVPVGNRIWSFGHPSSLRGGACDALSWARRASKELSHLRIAHLMEIAIEEADRSEPDRRLQADGFVRSPAQG